MINPLQMPRVRLAVLRVCFAAALACFPLMTRAQTAPDGNAHPVAQPIARESAELPSAFGEPPHIGQSPSVSEKYAFASQLNLEPLRSLAVWHDGRVKILDTLARETVLKLTGKRNYFDVVATDSAKPDSSGLPSGAGKKLNYDPVFTLLDLVIDPAYYYDRPLLAVDYLPLRRVFLEAAFPKDDAVVERWLKLQRISPRMVNDYGKQIAEEYFGEAPYRDALSRLDQQLEMWRLSKANMMLVAPESAEKPWLHLSQLPPSSPVRAAAERLGDAWRERDVAKANEAIASLASDLPNINAAQYPTSRRTLELAYNRAGAFEWGMWAYFFTFLALVLGFGTGRNWLLRLGVGMLVVAIGLHAFGFVTRCLIAERFAIQNQFESMTGLSLFAALVGFVILVLKRQYLFGAAAAGVGFLVLITATQTAIPGQSIEREAAILNTSILLKYHVTTVLVSYGLIALGFIISTFYLITHYAARFRAPGATVVAQVALGSASGPTVTVNAGTPEFSPARQKTLDDLDTAQMTVLQLAFWTLGVGILLGAWWADHSWGRWWAFDPKETWALITWIVYLIVIHLRVTTGRNKALITAWLSVIGFFVMLWTYFGVNLLLPGLHAYA
ncbi:MAG: cytochrome c biogenesis protein CcsA [Phycisphaeraceae bacterium]|nr:cytochrome c biogenesis protein CcsA [Phycisphaeraceae bacterium]